MGKESKEKISARNKRWYAANRERKRAACRAWYEKNKEAFLARRRAERAALKAQDPDALRIKEKMRRIAKQERDERMALDNHDDLG